MPCLRAPPQPIRAPELIRPIADFRKIQKVAHSKDSAIPEQSFAVLLPLKGVDQLSDFQFGQNTLLNRIAIAVNLAYRNFPVRHVHDFKVRHKQPVSLAALS